MSKIIERKGKLYLLTPKGAFEIEKIIKKEGKNIPIVKAKGETIEHPDGRKSVKIHVPILKIKTKGGDNGIGSL